jgi:hypothetical protein
VKAAPLLLLSSLAFAGDAPPPPSNPEVIARLEAIASKSARTPSDTPKFAFTGNLSLEHPASLDEATMGMPDVAIVDKAKTVVVTADPDTAWVSAHLGEYTGCAKDACAKQQPDTWLRASALFERVNGTWQPTAWAITPSIPSSSQQDAMEDNIVPDKLARDIAGAEDAVKVFESTIGDPKQFSATFSDRKEAVMFGSELPERYVGAKAKSQLAAWGFSFKVRDGVRAGVSKSGNIAWVAANVDAKSKKLAKTFPFRVFVLYEKIATTWKIVQLQFSTGV